MALHDSRYKRLHQLHAVNLEWMRHLSDQLGLGAVDPHSVEAHRVEYVTEQLTVRMADLAWFFRCEQGQGLLLLAEFQSTPDPALALRQYVYAFNHLLAGLQARRYSLNQGLPLPILVALYTGSDPWQAQPLEALFADRLPGGFPFPWFHYDMLHMDPTDRPRRSMLHTLFALECESGGRGYTAILQDFFNVHDDPETRAAFLSFAAATMSRWEGRVGPDGQPLNFDIEWESIRTLEELEMAENMLQERLDTWIAEGKAEGRAEGRAEGKAEGEARGKAEGEARGKAEGRKADLLELLEGWLEPQDVALCRAGLEDMSLDQMPTIGQVVRVLQAAGDSRAELVALFQAPS